MHFSSHFPPATDYGWSQKQMCQNTEEKLVGSPPLPGGPRQLSTKPVHLMRSPAQFFRLKSWRKIPTNIWAFSTYLSRAYECLRFSHHLWLYLVLEVGYKHKWTLGPFILQTRIQVIPFSKTRTSGLYRILDPDWNFPPWIHLAAKVIPE